MIGVALLTSLVKISIGINLGTMYVYTAEIFPSEFRAIGTSLVTVISRTGNILAPLVSNILQNINIMP